MNSWLLVVLVGACAVAYAQAGGYAHGHGGYGRGGHGYGGHGYGHRPRYYAGTKHDENNDGVPDRLDRNRDGKVDKYQYGHGGYGHGGYGGHGGHGGYGRGGYGRHGGYGHGNGYGHGHGGHGGYGRGRAYY